MVNNENLRPHGEAYELCVRELHQESPNFQVAQVFATLSVEEALRDLAKTISVAFRQLR